ncbi:MAG: hypothetical protein KF842_08600 [Caulobacter sp.]|nr:hypothetical protein [Caulobacter sp.]
MKWIDPSDLENWAKHRLSARVEFPALISDLIRATAPSVSSFRFPSGNKGQVRGFDGWLSAVGSPPFVPDGESVWEFGVSEKAQKKAETDLKKRTTELDAAQRANTTFVFVTPWTWDNQFKKLPDWITEQSALRSGWKDIRYIDGVQLASWLMERPAVAARYARSELQLVPKYGARSADEFWDEYSAKFSPRLAEEVLLASRSKQAEELISQLLTTDATLRYAADSPEEVIAFAIAAIRNADPETRLFLESRTIILDTEEAGRLLASRSSSIFFPRAQANQLSGLLASKGTTLISAGADTPKRDHQALNRPDTFTFGKAIQTMGFDEVKATELARTSGRSVTILGRQIPAGNVELPAWVHKAEVLIAPMLAGAWDTRNTPDRDILQLLTGGAKDHVAIERDLLPLKRLQDPPIDQAGTVWTMRAPVDAFIHLGHLLTETDFARLEQAATLVFSEPNPVPDPDAPYERESERLAQFSSWLRDGIANTLLVLAVLHEQAGVVMEAGSPQDWVNRIVEKLPGLAADHRLIESLRGQLPVLMEAAPDPLLKALEKMLEGDEAMLSGIFKDRNQGIFGPSSPHTGLLFALETLAWDPRYFRRVTLVLAGLARIDPGGDLGNRPIGSLREIFLPWMPQTMAGPEARLAALDEILASEPSIGWELLTKILPSQRDVSSPTSRPKFRDVGTSQGRLTYSAVWAMQNEVVGRAIRIAGNDPNRLATLARRFDHFSSDSRSELAARISDFLEQADEPARIGLWTALRDFLHRHRSFSDAKWALTEQELKPIDDLVERYEPSQPLEKVRWLFDDWFPEIPGKDRRDEEAVAKARKDAVAAIADGPGGRASILELARNAKLPWAVAQATSAAIQNDGEIQELLIATIPSSDGALLQFARALLNCYFARNSAAKELFSGIAKTQQWSAEAIASALSGLPDEPDTWDFAERFGQDVRAAYWLQKSSWSFKGDMATTSRLIDNYRSVGRPTAAIEAIYSQLKEVRPELLLQLLDDSIDELNAHPDRTHQMLTYHFSQTFEALRNNPEVPRIDIARREYAYFKLLEHEDEKLIIHEMAASDPEIFLMFIRDVFVPNDDKESDAGEKERPPPSAAEVARAETSYRLLSQLKVMPGHAGDAVNLEQLREWVLRARNLGAQAKLATVTDIYIGHLLAHAPLGSDGAWPHEAVRDLIEELKAVDVERGINTERFNMRGVHWRNPDSGGDQERELAASYYGWAKTAQRWPRTASLLESIGDNWESHAKWVDLDTAQENLRR